MSGRHWREKSARPCPQVSDEFSVTNGGHPEPKEEEKGEEKEGREEDMPETYTPSDHRGCSRSKCIFAELQPTSREHQWNIKTTVE